MPTKELTSVRILTVDMMNTTKSVDWLFDEIRQHHSKVLAVDCRCPTEYQRSHVRGAVNVALPSLMLRRLATGRINISSVIRTPGGDRDQLGKTVILYDDFDTQDMGCTNNVVMATVYKRLVHEGFEVAHLEGGYASFKVKYPEWCTSTSCDISPVVPQTPLFTAPSTPAPPSTTLLEPPTTTAISPQLSPTPPIVIGLQNLKIAPADATTDSSTKSGFFSFSSSSDSSDDDRCDSGRDSTSTPHLLLSDASGGGGLFAASFPVEILPNLFLGNAQNALDPEALAMRRIKYVINVTRDLPNAFEEGGAIKYLQIPITDHWSQNLAGFFPQAISFIDEAHDNNAGVLVHCLAGISRSVTVIVAYLMHKHRMSLNSAYDFVKQRKANIAPNFNFMGQLLDYEQELVKEYGELGLTSSPPFFVNDGLGLLADEQNSESDTTLTDTRLSLSPCTWMVPSPGSKHSLSPRGGQDLSPVESGGEMVPPDSGIDFDTWI